MSWSVTIRPRAEADLRRGRQWYEREQRGLGEQFLEEMFQLLGSLEQQPERGRV